MAAGSAKGLGSTAADAPVAAACVAAWGVDIPDDPAAVEMEPRVVVRVGFDVRGMLVS